MNNARATPTRRATMRLPHQSLRYFLQLLTILGPVILLADFPAAGFADSLRTTPALIRSARNGPWSAPATWEGNKVPAAGARVQVRQGHTVVYDVASDQPLRSVHVAGTLTFAP